MCVCVCVFAVRPQAEQARIDALEQKRAYNLLAIEQRLEAKNAAYLKHNQEIARSVGAPQASPPPQTAAHPIRHRTACKLRSLLGRGEAAKQAAFEREKADRVAARQAAAAAAYAAKRKQKEDWEAAELKREENLAIREEKRRQAPHYSPSALSLTLSLLTLRRR